MDEPLKLSEVFVPNGTPGVTYIDRSSLGLEKQLSEALKLPKMVVSISGPSKTGKTVLISKVVDTDYIIPVVSTGLKSTEDLWNRVLQWMDVPTSFTASKASSSGSDVGAGAKAGAKIPFIADIGANSNYVHKSQTTSGSSQSHESTGLTRVISEIAGSDFIVFIDDFHYISEGLMEEIGREIKVATDMGVKVLTASVPHRADDVVRSNSELRGRVAAIDIGRWDPPHLREIPTRGFSALNLSISEASIDRLVDEAQRSPQLMQTLCYCLCQVLNVSEAKDTASDIEISDNQFREALKRTTQFTDFSKMLQSLHSGPPTRGTERKIHSFNDGSSGDVYRCVLLSIQAEPIQVSFPYQEVFNRIKRICVGDTPVGSSISSCLEQMHKISENLQPGNPVLAWDGDTLDVVDPYFSFFLRCSDKMKQLSNA